MNAIGIGDFENIYTLSNLSSRDKSLLVTATRADIAANAYQTTLMCKKEGDASFVPLPYRLRGKDYARLRDGRILYPAALAGEDAEYVREGGWRSVFCAGTVDGQAPVELFRVPLPSAAATEIAPDLYLLSATCDITRPDIEALPEAERKQALAAYKAEQEFVVCDELPYNGDGRGFVSKKRKRLFLYRARENSLTALAEPLFETAAHAVSPDGAFVAFAGYCYDTVGSVSQGLWLYEVASGKTETIYPPEKYSIGTLVYIGETLYMAAAPYRGYGSQNELSLYRAAAGEAELVLDLSLEDLGVKAVTDCKGSGTTLTTFGEKLYYITTHHSTCTLWSLLPGGAPERETAEDFDAEHFAVSQDGLFVCGARWGDLQEIYRLSGGELAAQSGFNRAFIQEHTVSIPEFLPYQNREGMQLEGFVIKPAGFDPAKRYPGILNIHGGPRMTYSAAFNHEIQLFASKGYFVFYCNPRGSSGWGNRFADIRGVRGTIDYYDIMDFTEAALAAYPQLDRERLGVTGGSYGGYMTNWIIGHTDLFKAAVSCRSNSNIIGNYGVSDRGMWSCEGSYGGNIWDAHDLIWEQSPLKHVRNAKTPTLFLHSLEDHRCRFPNSAQMYTALMMHGVPTRMVLIKGESHGLSRGGKPVKRVRRLREIADWMDRWI